MKVTKLHCTNCHTTIENQFELSKFVALTQEQLHFVEVFITCRGNIKEVEKELGISYPTVRGKLTDIISALGYEPEKKEASTDKSKVIQMLENGEISSEDAIKLLKEE